MRSLKNCCFFINLKTGGKIIGWLDIIHIIVATVVVLIGIGLTGKFDNHVLLSKLLVVNVILIATTIFFAWKLIDGIKKLDSHKVNIFKWYTIITLIHEITQENINGFAHDYWTTSNILIEIFRILWFCYKIYVAHSIEVMLKEELPTVNNHQMQPKNAENGEPPKSNNGMTVLTA